MSLRACPFFKITDVMRCKVSMDCIGVYFDAARINKMSGDIHLILRQTDALYAYLLHQLLCLGRVWEHDKCIKLMHKYQSQ